MKKILISILIFTFGYVGFAQANNSSAWKGSSGFNNGHSNFGYGLIFNKSHKQKQRRCSRFLSIWWPDHPRACPPIVTWIKLASGLSVGTTQQAFDRYNSVFYSDIVIQNDTGLLIPEGSRLIITETNLAVLNNDGLTEGSDLPYFSTIEDIADGAALSLRAEFEIRRRGLSFSVDFEVAEVSDGAVEISGTPMVTKRLDAEVTDPDGISAAVSYQWLANGNAIAGATSASYTPVEADEGILIGVVVTYTDDIGFDEVVTSGETSPVLPRPDNVVGSLSIDGEKLVGSVLNTILTDSNGVSSDVTYQWFIDGDALENETSASLVLNTEYAGRMIAVSAVYSDDDSYDEMLMSASTSRIVTTIVSGEAELIDALATAANGDWIGLADGDYDGMAELNIDDGIAITLAENSDALISGATCIVLDGNKSALVGLSFGSLDMLTGSSCDSNGDSSVYMSGDSTIVSRNSFNGEVASPSSSTYNWISVKGSYSLIERNAFFGKDMDRKGAPISIYNNASIGDQYGHVVQYNLFKDFPGGAESSAYAIQLGRSTDSSSNGDGGHVLRYNRFENVKSKQRIIKVQSSRNAIYGNTIEDSIGNVSLENGQENTVANNVILPTGEDEDSNDGGIAFAPYGHVITNNYIAGLRTTSSQRGGLTLNSDEFGDSGSAELVVTAVTVANNTIINSRHPINMSSKGCIEGTFIVDFDSNLIANGEDPTPDSGTDYGFEGKTANGDGRDAVIDTCGASAETTHDNEHYYSADLDKNGTFSFNAAGTDNIFGAEGDADLIAANHGLFEGQGVDEGIGADTTNLIYLTSEDVGPDSTFIASQAQVSYPGDITFGEAELRTWNITFPSGESEKDPQWLIDGNTSVDEFFYGEDGSMIFRCPNYGGTTTNSSFSRTELREMLRGPDADYNGGSIPKTQGYTENNWVFSTANFTETQPLMGGVDGTMNATLRVDHVSTSGESGKVGRVIVGQIHASSDEPMRLYYRKLPGNELGSVYFAHEIPNVGDQLYNLIGTSSASSPNPVDGIALGEIWSYEIVAVARSLTVTIRREGKPDVSKTIEMAPAYYQDWMYFKAGAYNQNNTGDLDDYVQVTFYSLTKTHGGPVDNSEDDDGGTGAGEVTDGTSLQAAIDAAVVDDVIELGAGDYSNIGAITVGVPGVTITAAEGSGAEITGSVCFYVPTDNVIVTGLVFRDIAFVAGTPCESNGDGAIVITGDDVEFSQNLIDGDALNPVVDGEDTFNWLVLKGSNAIVERNTFQNKRGLTFDGSAQLKGAFISLFVTGSGQNNVVQYNLFKDMLLNDQSTATAIGLGRTTGSDSWDTGNHTVQYNRFDNIDSKTRVIRVQGSLNEIRGNTVVNSQGMIALEDGYGNTVIDNVILPSGSDSNDGGISFAPYGHTITNNYIAGARTTSSERASLMVNWNAAGSGNSDPNNLASPVIISGNTVLNAKQPIMLSSKSCGSENFVAEFSSNLIANGVDGVSDAFEGTTHSNYPAIRDDCALDPASTFTSENYFTGTLSTSGTLTLNGTGNVLDTEGNANIQAATNGFIEESNGPGTNNEFRRGADPASLNLIEESDVGVGSITVF